MVDRGGVRVRGLAVGSLAALIVALVPGLAGALPDGRRYELVTPVQKNAADVLPNPQRTRAALDGGAIQYSSLTGFGDVHGGSRATDYIAVRGADGVWRTHGIYPIQDASAFVPDVGAGFEPRYMGEFSSDLSHGIFMAKSPLTNAPNVAHVPNLYQRTDLLTPGAGAYELLTDAVSDQGPYDPTFALQPAVADASADFSHVLFESSRNLLAETASLPADQPKLYEWVDGSTRLVGMVPTAPDEECGGSGPACVPSASQAGQGANPSSNAYTLTTISTDGRHVNFTVPDPNQFGQVREGQLYIRDDQATPALTDDVTVHVNASERATPDTPANATFWAASSDCTKVFFTTAEKLTEEDPNNSNDLYRYDQNADVGSRLTRISIDTEPGDNQDNDLANGHNVAGAIGASTDGDSVYFIVAGSGGSQLIAGGSTTQPAGNAGAQGNARIYRWQLGTVHEVGGINDTAEVIRILGRFGWGFLPKWGRVSPDGQHLAFITQGTDQLLSHYGKPEQDHGNTCSTFTSGHPACLEVYVYDAAANSGNGDLQCASCDPTGMPADGDVEFFVHFALGASLDTSHLNHPLSDDGRFVFFDSDDQLVPADKNNVTDPYQFNTETGQVSLLSSGTSPNPSIFMDASADGRDVYILTRSQLRSEDHDQSTDLYDARIGGTIDPGASTPAVCEDEDCRPAAVPTVRAQAPASLAFEGPADRLAPKNPAAFFHTETLTRRQRRHLARAGTTRLEVSTSRGGLITIRVRARINGRSRVIQTIHRHVGDAATIHPRIRLTAAARHQLAAHGHLALAITTTYNQATTPQTVRIRLSTARR